MTKQKKNKQVNTYRIQSIILTVALVASLCMISALALISFGAAVFAFGFTMLSFMFLFERSRRSHWEGGIEKAINTLDAAHEFMARQVRKNSEDIKTLSTQKPIMLKERIRKKGPRKSFSFAALLKQTGTLKSPPARPKTEVQKTLARDIPKPGRPKSASQNGLSPTAMPATPPAIANDESPSYYNGLSDTVVKELVGHAVRHNTMTVFMQPIVRLPEQSVRGYEVFSRVRSRPGQYIPAQRYLDMARKDKTIINAIDHTMLMRCLDHIRSTADTKINTLFFLNITAGTLRNKLFMNRLLGFIANNRSLAGRLVFEISQQDFETMDTGTQKIVHGIGQLGCSLSLDHVNTLNFDIRTLQDHRIRFVKIKAADLIQKSNTDGKRNALWRIKRRLESNGIGVIAEKIEDQAMMDKLSTLDLHYGQGYLFGRPALRDTQKAA